MNSLGRVRELIIQVLAGISPDSGLTDLAESPDGRWYTITIHVPGTISKAFVVPMTLVDSDSRMLRNVLRVEMLMQRSRVAVDRSRETLAGLHRVSPAVCPRCSAPIPPGDSVRFEHGDVFHLRCRPLPTS